MAANLNALAPRESGWVDRLFTQQNFSPAYQDLKFVLHRKLLDRINLEMLSSVAVDLDITQLVDGKSGVHAMCPKSIFESTDH